ncbi:MAG: aminodeoxychorismate/anthranilate synthase component II [Candidatus Delongbacteria bacterium]
MKILLLDNYDSFTYNLKAQLERCSYGSEVTVKRNRDESVFDLDIGCLVISPGPMTWKETGVLKSLFEKRIIPEMIPVLGICLGMQFLAGYYGLKVDRISNPVHGSAVEIIHGGSRLFNNIPATFTAARYNSLGLVNIGPGIKEMNGLVFTSFEKDTGIVMSLEHKELPFAGFQFHTESFLTNAGDELISNFMEMHFEDRT